MAGATAYKISSKPFVDIFAIETCTASNLQQIADLLCVQANSASYPQWMGNE